MSLFEMFHRKNKRTPSEPIVFASIAGEEYYWLENSEPVVLLKSYQDVDDFFTKYITDPTRNRLTESVLQPKGDNLVLLATYEDRIVGAIWAGAPHTEADDAILRGQQAGKSRQMNSLAKDMRDSTFMLHNMAVDPEFRNKGFGRSLLLQVTEEATLAGKSLLWGVASADALDFYRRTSLEVAPTEGILTLSNAPGAIYGLPLDGESRWVYRHLKRPSKVRAGFKPLV